MGNFDEWMNWLAVSLLSDPQSLFIGLVVICVPLFILAAHLSSQLLKESQAVILGFRVLTGGDFGTCARYLAV